MTDSIISLRISKEMLEKMRTNDEVNWSAFLRNCLNKQIEQTNFADKNKMKKAEEIMKKMREISKSMGGGKTTTEIIREWRDKRK
jgi:hypothetical protein